MMSGISWSMTVLPSLNGTVDKTRLKAFMDPRVSITEIACALCLRTGQQRFFRPG